MVCKRCLRPIAGKKDDPIVIISAGTFHYECMKSHVVAVAHAEAAAIAATRARRAENARRNFHGHTEGT